MRQKYFRLFLAALIGLIAVTGAGCKKKKVEKSVYFISPNDGDEVEQRFQVKFGVKGLDVRPAGEDVLDKTSGHHHIIVDHKTGYIRTGQVVPKDKTHIHYGKGQQQDTLELAPGEHTLSLQFADGAHLSYGKPLSKTIKVKVKATTKKK